MDQLEIDDIQGVIRRGYGVLTEAKFVMFKFSDKESAKSWIAEIAEVVQNGENKPTKQDQCVNVAFTQKGFDFIDLENAFDGQKRFSVEFEDGMVTSHRKRVLGDFNESSPDEWEWGGTTNNEIHVLLMLYTGSSEHLAQFYKFELERASNKKLIEIHQLDTSALPDRKEHFGFRDGIAQPKIAGLIDKHKASPDKKKSSQILSQGGSYNNIIAAGEFILGYPNAYKKIPNSPKVKVETDKANVLPLDDAGVKDLGKNGSYLVFRQLEQHVDRFWNYVNKEVKGEDGNVDNQERDKLAAKMVGRWRSGCPITTSPEVDNPEMQDKDNFGYYPDDKDGLKCPMASHIRRTNPRNSPLQRDRFNDKEAENAMVDANKHRIIRRGRAYGESSRDENDKPSMEPEDILKPGNTGSRKVGLHFICFNANIGRQFEFIQQTWINNPKFSKLYSEADPLLGSVDDKAKSRGIFGDFTAPDLPVRDRVRELKQFVTVKGGAYFFMPGIKALKYLSNL